MNRDRLTANLSRGQRAQYERLCSYLAEYTGASGVERRAREQLVINFLARVN